MYGTSPSFFRIGERVELHPATDLFMRGARYGTVVFIGRRLVSVALDVTGRSVKFQPQNLRHIPEVY